MSFSESVAVDGKSYSTKCIFDMITFFERCIEEELIHEVIQIRLTFNINYQMENHHQSVELNSIDDMINNIHSKDILKNFRIMMIAHSNYALDAQLSISIGGNNQLLNWCYVSGINNLIVDRISRKIEEHVAGTFQKVASSHEEKMKDLNETLKRVETSGFISQIEDIAIRSESVNTISNHYFSVGSILNKFGLKHQYAIPVITLVITAIGVLIALFQ